MKRNQFFIVVLLLALFSLTACGSDKEPAPTKSETSAQALTNLNLRQGPGTDYAIAGKLPESAEIAVVGRNEDSSWLYVRTDSGDEVWLINNPELVKVDADSVKALSAVESPPPPYNVNNSEVNKALNEIPFVIHHENSFTCASHGGLNHLLPEVTEGHVLGPLSGDLVYKGNNVLFKRSGNSFVLIREDPVARFEGDKESLSFTEAMKLFEAGEITWTGDFGKPGRGVPGCDPKAP